MITPVFRISLGPTSINHQSSCTSVISGSSWHFVTVLNLTGITVMRVTPMHHFVLSRTFKLTVNALPVLLLNKSHHLQSTLHFQKECISTTVNNVDMSNPLFSDTVHLPTVALIILLPFKT